MSEMTHQRMAAILATYGARPARWPEPERAAAEAWAAANPERFTALSVEEAMLDAVLDLDRRETPANDDLAARILAARADANVVRPQFGAQRATWMQAAALAACAVIGLAVGFTNAPAREDVAGDFDAAFTAAFDLSPVAGGAGNGG